MSQQSVQVLSRSPPARPEVGVAQVQPAHNHDGHDGKDDDDKDKGKKGGHHGDRDK